MKLLILLFTILQAAPSDATEWKPLAIDDNLTVKFPAEHEVQETPFQQTYTASREGDPIVLVRIDNSRAPEDYRQDLAVKDDPTGFYRGFINGFAQSQNLIVSDYRSVAVDGLEGIQFTAAADTIMFTSQAVLVGDIIYAGTVYYTEDQKDSVANETERLFSSFDFAVDPRNQFLESQESDMSDFNLGKLAGKLIIYFLIGAIIFIVVRSVSNRRKSDKKD
ncbi:MAG: hypothetical protein WBB45_00790 [Cyclobacteriaceae bacterium]